MPHATCHMPQASFKALKARRKAAEKLPSTEKVDCLTVSLAPLKAALEDQHTRLSDALLFGMRRGAASRQQEIADFVTQSMESLARRPQSVEEVLYPTTGPCLPAISRPPPTAQHLPPISYPATAHQPTLFTYSLPCSA